MAQLAAGSTRSGMTHSGHSPPSVDALRKAYSPLMLRAPMHRHPAFDTPVPPFFLVMALSAGGTNCALHCYWIDSGRN